MRLAVLTGGGDCPGLNAAIRAVVRRAMVTYGDELLGVADGWRGMIENDLSTLDIERCRGILPRGGTILGTSRVNPFAVTDGVEHVRNTLQEREIDLVIAIGGEGTLGAAAQLSALGIPIVAIPKTIDNDINATDLTIGFDTAVGVAVGAIDRLHSTAESHDRVMVCEVMGRHAGWIALYSGLAAGAAVIVVPEEPFDVDKICDHLVRRHSKGRYASIVVVAEGAKPVPGSLDLQPTEIDQYNHERLGGISSVIAREIEARTSLEARVTILGHIQRGGTPSAFDRVLATRFGIAAVDAAHNGPHGTMVALRGTGIELVPIETAVSELKGVPAALLEGVTQIFLD